MLDTHVDKHDLVETNVPVLVREEMMYGTGQLPKFGEDSYKTTDGWWLIPTAEVPLTKSGQWRNAKRGPPCPCALLPTLCVFAQKPDQRAATLQACCANTSLKRSEMVSITHPDASTDEHNRMTKCAEAILEALNLAYRTVLLCTGDLGAGMRKTHDIEVWLPGQKRIPRDQLYFSGR